MLTVWILNVLSILCLQQRGSPAVLYINSTGYFDTLMSTNANPSLLVFKIALRNTLFAAGTLSFAAGTLLSDFFFTWKNPLFFFSEKYLALMYSVTVLC